MSTTRAVSIRNFRENMTKLLKEAQEKDVHFVVMRHSEVVAHVTPAKRRDSSLEALRRDVAIARQQVKDAKTFTTKEARAILGL